MTILTKKNSKIAIIITAAGSSTRMGGGIKKEYLPLNNGTVLSNCAINFLKAAEKFGENCILSDLVVTYPANGRKDSEEALFYDKDFSLLSARTNVAVAFVEGSKTRQSSVFNAVKYLAALSTPPDYVLIHDGARPFVSDEIICDVLSAAMEFGASVPGVVPVDTQKEIDDQGFIVRHLVRSKLTAVQTPQGFKFDQLYSAHKQAAEDGIEYTDDTEVWGNYIGQVKVVPGSIENKKITYPGDL